MKNRILSIAASLMMNKQEPTVTNVIFNSLSSPGGTITDEEEIKAVLFNNLFYFNDGLILINDGYCMINDKMLKIEASNEFTIKVMKTKVKAIGGSEGLKKFVNENRTIGSLWFSSLNKICKQL